MNAVRQLDRLAALLEYPGKDYSSRVEVCRAVLEEDREAAALLDRFAAAITGLPLESLQELFIQTFDLNPVCSLEVGWHLYGENYERGTFLVHMRGELRRFGLPESDELPDHLTHVLAVMVRMEPEDGCQFAARFVLPALNKMLAGLKDKGNPFECVMQVVWRAVHALCPDAPLNAERVSGFQFPVIG